MVDADWTFDRVTANFRYIGDDHNGAAPSYATLLEFHRWAQARLDDEVSVGDDELDITVVNATIKQTDNILTLPGNANVDDTAVEHLFDGTIVQGSGSTETIYDGVVNFGNPFVQIQIHQDGAVLADDWWNKTLGGAHDGAADAAVLTDSGETWTVDEWVGYTIYNTTDGSQGIITANTASTITATLEGGTDNDWDVADTYELGVPVNPSSAQGISHRFMIKVRENGADIDGRRVLGISRRLGKTYGEFLINGTNRGNNTLALSDTDDAFNTTAAATIAGWTNITNGNEGYTGIDVDNNAVNEFYYSNWDIDTQTISDFSERTKWLTRQGSSSTLYAMNGELFRGITHDITYDVLSGTFDELQDLVWGTEVAFDAALTAAGTVGEYYTFSLSGAVGKLLALDDNTGTGFAVFAIEPGSGTVVDNDVFTRADGTAADGATVNVTVNNAAAVGGKGRILADDGVDQVWIQLLTGQAPVDNLPIWEATTAGVYDNATGDNATVNVTVTSRAVSTPFSGQSTGANILGAYGVGIEATDLTAQDRVTDLGANNVSPPDFRTFSLGGLVIGEDRVLVGPWDGVSLDPLGNPAVDKDQLTLLTTLSGATETAVVVTAAIPVDTPNTGTIRIELDDGRERRVAYTSWTGSTFTIASTDFTGGNVATQPTNVWISYLDLLATATTHSYTGVYSGADRDLVGLVRDGAATPIKEYIAPLVFPGAATAIRNPD